MQFLSAFLLITIPQNRFINGVIARASVLIDSLCGRIEGHKEARKPRSGAGTSFASREAVRDPSRRSRCSLRQDDERVRLRSHRRMTDKEAAGALRRDRQLRPTWSSTLTLLQHRRRESERVPRVVTDTADAQVIVLALHFAFVGGSHGLFITRCTIGMKVSIGSFGYLGSNDTSSYFAQKSTVI
jgi:hypothetical protein